MNFAPLTLEDRGRYLTFLRNFPSEASELTFSNLFMWRRKYDFHLAESEGFLWILNKTPDDRWYLSPPLGDYTVNLSPSLQEMQRYLKDLGRPMVMRKVSGRVLEQLRPWLPQDAEIVPMRKDFDYLYDFQQLATLPGASYHKKKNHVNRFQRLYPDWHYEPLSEESVPEIADCLDRWCQERGCDADEGLSQERVAILDGLDRLSALGIDGGLIRIQGRAEAFTLAERLNDETTVIHIEKAGSGFDGLYAAINQAYLAHCPHPTRWVNREQDLGIPGLIKAKESYHPVGFVEKYEVTLP